jgi:hypothetical protein
MEDLSTAADLDQKFNIYPCDAPDQECEIALQLNLTFISFEPEP